MSYYRWHPPIDNSVAQLEREEIEYDASHFNRDLRNDLKTRRMDWLQRHYPELTFAHIEVPKGRPLGHDYVEELRKGLWIAADWRHS